MPEMSDKDFTRVALNAGLVTPDMVKECFTIQKRVKEMGLLPKSLKGLLVEKGYIADDVARKISRGEQAEEAKKKEKVVRIGGYEVISRLGKGQMGSVYKARQVSLDRIVALKVLPSRLAGDKRYLQRFLREAKAAGRLNHPNIVTAVDFGESGGLYYYAMDLIEGVNVGEILEEEGKLGEDEALAITLQMARALEHAHENNIIHRDIKPENIMLDSDGRARLCDLGLAREAREEGALTQVGIALGTPYYISPEQAQGKRDLDTRSDIYSLGVTLFHMVTGQVPFTGPTGPAIMVKHVTEKMPGPREFNPDLSNGTTQLIKKMTAKKRTSRYQTPADLIKDIERVIAGERPAAAGPVIRARKPRRAGAPREEIVVGGGGRKFIPLIAIGLVVLIVIIAVASMSGRPDTGQRTGSGRRPGPVSPVPDSTTGPGHAAGTGSLSPDATSTRRETPSGPRGLPSEQHEVMQLIDWARKHPNETAEVARKYGEFIETATDPKAVTTARQALEGVAAKEYISLQRKFESFIATGKVNEALNEAAAYLKLFGKTKSAGKAMALLEKARKERVKTLNDEIAKVMVLANSKKFTEALDRLAELADVVPEDLKPRVAEAKTTIEKAHKDFIAASRVRAEDTREEFDRKLAARIAALDLDGAVMLINERVRVEVDPARIEMLRTRAADLAEARGALVLVMANLKNLIGLKQTFNIDRKGDETGTIEKVGADSFVFASGAVTREVRLNRLNAGDIVRLAELNLGPEEARSRYQMGLFFLLVMDDPQEARGQLTKAGELGMDTSRFEKKVAASKIQELISKAEDAQKRKKFLDAAMDYSSVLKEMAGLAEYAEKSREVQQKVDFCLRESGAQDAFAGRVSIENGGLAVFYDFADPGQWLDFKAYVWSEKHKQPLEWIAQNGVLTGKGSEAVIWKGQFSGDVCVELDVTPKQPEQPSFFLRLCDDGKGNKGKNYSFGFGFKEIRRVPVGRRGKEIIYRTIEGTPEITIAKLRGSAKKYTYLKRGIHFPQIKAGNTYKVRIERVGNTLRTLINGATVAQVEDKDYKKGGFTLRVTNNSTVNFDNIKITGEFNQLWLSRELRKAKR